MQLPDYLITFLLLATFPYRVVARLCDGGHRCSPPKECCPQGCCYLYAPPSAPRSLPPATDHVLNLFFINHWYFWCLVVALILAILCACSLWKKRRQLCGWGLSDRHIQSEGDSAGSCYAPPQYSRCSSFHHPPPPYTEVTSKPDLYPLVFTCNGDNGKNGASYLMVQYFRNYIVRPAGSLSATSTVDSLSSSFICNANEANTLVPPPYSRAASPDAIGITTHFQHFMMPRSASQLVCSQQQIQQHGQDMVQQQMLQSRQNASNLTNNSNLNTSNHSGHYYFPNSTQLRTSESVNFQNIRMSGSGSGLGSDGAANRGNAAIIGSQSDQQFRYIANSNSNLSDIFVNSGSSCNNNSSSLNNNNARMSGTDATCQAQAQINNNLNYNNKSSTNQFATTNTVSTKTAINNSSSSNNNPIYNSCSSIGGISITVPVATDADSEYRDLHALRRSLETCCQILQQHQMPSDSFNSADSPVNVELGKKFETGIRSYVTSTTCSAVSSLANIGSPSSPPQATSPTGEVKELLEQIRQLKPNNSIDSTVSDPPAETQLTSLAGIGSQPQHFPRNLPPHGLPKNSLASAFGRRPSTLQSRKKFFLSGSSSSSATASSTSSKPNKAMYIPINSNCSVRTTLRSPVGAATNILTRGRGRRGWISRSAPTTPGTTLPPSRLGDDSPLLLNEHDEENESNQ